MKKLLTNKLFTLTFISDKISNFGDVLYYLALMNYVLLLPSPQFALSIITFSETLPILTGFALGIYADKTKNKLDTILLTLLARFVFYLLVGFLMGFEPSLWVIIVVSIINLFSDLLGQYENGLFTPIALRIIEQDDRQQALAFRQSIGSLLSIAFQSLGAILVGLMTFRHLAFFNAATFAIAGLITIFIKKDILTLVEQNPIQLSEDLTNSQNNIFKEMWVSSQMVLTEIKAIPVLQKALIIGPALNAIFSALNVILVYHLSQNKEMIVHNPATTIAIFTTSLFLGNIIGAALVMGPAKDVDIIAVLNLAMILPIFVFVSFIFHNIYLVIFFLFITCVTSGLINPKLSALIMNSLPEDRLATIGAGLDTYFTTSMFLTKLIVAGLLLVLTADQVTWLFILASAVILGYFLKGLLGRRQSQNEDDVKA